MAFRYSFEHTHIFAATSCHMVCAPAAAPNSHFLDLNLHDNAISCNVTFGECASPTNKINASSVLRISTSKTSTLAKSKYMFAMYLVCRSVGTVCRAQIISIFAQKHSAAKLIKPQRIPPCSRDQKANFFCLQTSVKCNAFSGCR